MSDDPRRPRPDALDEERPFTRATDSQPAAADAANPADLDAVQAMARGLTPRFEDGEWHERGGMGALTEVHDQLLGRTLVRKRPRRRRRTDAGFRAFVHEAQVTAGLSHPAIVPLYELLHDEQGYSYLMPRIEGITLHDVFKGIVAGDLGTLRRYGLPRLLGIFRTVCGAIAHAHERGVVHRDLKPNQILLGKLDEVRVVDWGLAARSGGHRGALDDPVGGSLSTGSIRSGQTVLKGLHGSPIYQPPERLVLGAVAAHPTQDVYALGAILYQLLTNEPPIGPEREGESGAAYLERARDEIASLRPPSAAGWVDSPDPAWDRICLRCLASDPADRYANAGVLFKEVEGALSDLEARQRRRARAAACLRAGRAALDELEEARRALAGARDLRRKLADDTPPHAPLERKRALWEAEDRVEALDRAHEERYAAVEGEFEKALGHDRESKAARAALADLHMARMVQAEADGTGGEAAYHRARLETFDDGSRVVALGRGGTLRIEGQPARATARLAQLEEIDRRRVPGDWRPIDAAGEAIDLESGSYQIEIAAPGRATARYALRIDRGSIQRLAPRLPERAAVPAGFVYLPAGPCLVGGDPLAQDAGPRRRVDMPDLAIGEFPVTLAQYLVFLEALSADELDERVPRDAADGIPYVRREHGTWILADPHGQDLDETYPVFSIRAEDAEAYARWLTGVRGRTFRLPTRDEWEYAARGGDGRFFAWGDHFEPSYCWAGDRQRGRKSPAPVGRCPEDVTAAGVRDLTGGVGDWLADAYGDDDSLRGIGGGTWFASERSCRLSRRFGFPPGSRTDGLGFRLVCDLP